MLQMLNAVIGLELIVLVMVLIKAVRSTLKDTAIEKNSMAVSFDIPKFINNAKIFIYEEDSMVAGYQKGSKIYINVFDSSSFENASTAVHEYVHVWQYRNHKLMHYMCKFIDKIRYGSSIMEKHAYIVESMYSMCIKFGWNFDYDQMIPFVWNRLISNKWDYDKAYSEACMLCKKLNQK